MEAEEAMAHKATHLSKTGMHLSAILLIIRVSAVRGQEKPEVLVNRIEIEMEMEMLVVETRHQLRSVE